jgi:hypothetical protein
MKLLLLAAFAVFSISASSQTFKTDVQKLMKESELGKRFNSRLQFQRPIYKDSLIKDLKSFLSSEKRGPGVYFLPQDNMPCLIPDTRDIAMMPNAWPSVQVPFKSAIPNPGLKNKTLIEPKNKTK